MLTKKLQASIKSKSKKTVIEPPVDVKDYILFKMKEELTSWLEIIKPEVLSVVEDVVTREISDLRQKEMKNIKKGDKGDKGADSFVPGPKGEKGDDGYTPVKGVDYFDGKDGKDGKDGRDGKDGKNGIDGSPDKPEEIATKLNTLEGAVEMSVIEGLQEMFANIQRAFNQRDKGGGGGGMGNVITQSTALSSATTTITLQNNVASGGKAIWFNYQGQQQAYGEHFTVSGKTITLLFTPDDSTFADIIYIRA